MSDWKDSNSHNDKIEQTTSTGSAGVQLKNSGAFLRSGGICNEEKKMDFLIQMAGFAHPLPLRGVPISENWICLLRQKGWNLYENGCRGDLHPRSDIKKEGVISLDVDIPLRKGFRYCLSLRNGGVKRNASCTSCIGKQNSS